MRKHLSTILLIVTFLIGLSLLLYPTFSNWWNSFRQSRAIMDYAEHVSEMDNTVYERMMDEARLYNAELNQSGIKWELTEEEMARYNATLAVTTRGIMSNIEIPKINVQLPVYHGTGETILQSAVGHVAGTSLPVGGTGSHCILSGHRGLPSARLFTDLDKLTTGDTFLIRTLDEVLTYEIDQINIVEPYDLSLLSIEDGEDYCTLITCTPYGINTHRLLVRGHRIETVNAVSIRVVADALHVDPVIVAPVVSVPILLLLLFVTLVTTRKKKR